MEFTSKDLARFFEKIEIVKNKCWQWKGATIKQGYGNFYAQGKYLRAHRVSWMVHYGEIPENLVVCHKCNNTGCVNPKHLYIGTQWDNIDQMTREGRRTLTGKRAKKTLIQN